MYESESVYRCFCIHCLKRNLNVIEDMYISYKGDKIEGKVIIVIKCRFCGKISKYVFDFKGFGRLNGKGSYKITNYD